MVKLLNNLIKYINLIIVLLLVFLIMLVYKLDIKTIKFNIY